MPHVRRKTKSYVKKIVCMATFAVQKSGKLILTFALMISQNSLKMNHLDQELDQQAIS